MKFLKVFFLLVVILLLLVFGAYKYLSHQNSYQLDGEINVPGLDTEVKIYRTADGMPYIYAGSERDLIFAQGYVTAQDRLFQMQLTRWYAEGRLSELAGEVAKPIDVKMRTLGFARNATKHASILNKSTRAFLQAYTDGINAFIIQGKDIPLEFRLAGIEPELWSIENSLSVMYYMGWGSSGNMNTELLSLALIEKLGVDAFLSIYPQSTNLDDYSNVAEDTAFYDAARKIAALGEGFQSIALMPYADPGLLHWGSNNWALDGSRSESGAPIIASDPHLDARILPGIMHPIGLFMGDDVRAVGVTVPGIPGLLIGRTKYLSNGITNAYVDMQDLYIEKVDPDDADYYLEGEKRIPFEKITEFVKVKDASSEEGWRVDTLSLLKTRRGVVVSDIFPLLAGEHCLSLRYAPFETMGEELGLDYLFKAKTAADAGEYLSKVTITANNFTVADLHGDIAWYIVGRAPIRRKGDGRVPTVVVDSLDNWQSWIPFEEMPHRLPGHASWLGNGNHNYKPGDYPYYISNYFSPYYRYAALIRLMNSKQKFSVEDNWLFQRDDFNTLAPKLVPLFVKALKENEETRAMAEELENWDYHQSIESVGATIFQNIYRILPMLIFEDELGADLASEMLGHWYFWQETVEKMLLDGESSWFNNIRTESYESRDELILKAALQAKTELGNLIGSDIKDWRWGKLHQIQYTNPIRREGLGKKLLGAGPYPMGGSGETLYRALYDYNKPNEVIYSACLRMVADMGDNEKVLAVVNGGVSARTFHPFQKSNISDYIDGSIRYWWFSDEKIESNAAHELRLKP